MALFIGHGMLENYSREINIEDTEKLEYIIEFLKIPENLKEHVIFIRNHSKLDKDDLIKNEDEVHFYIIPFGG
ncbi:MAG: hypothetical protein ACPLRZ_02165 [Thermovenabulum sp.]|uniref:hypothetical protein n=1 Tax=Thermovenabulum sp. TaxID=3100335 RepID=UPI003C7E6D49